MRALALAVLEAMNAGRVEAAVFFSDDILGQVLKDFSGRGKARLCVQLIVTGYGCDERLV